MRNSIGLIEVEGLVGALEAADAAAKAANINLVGMEAAKGSGMITVKIEGEVAAVTAGIEAGAMAASRLTKIISKHVIARPNRETYKLIDTYVEESIEKIEKIEISDTERRDIRIVEEIEEIKEINKNKKAKK